MIEELKTELNSLREKLQQTVVLKKQDAMGAAIAEAQLRLTEAVDGFEHHSSELEHSLGAAHSHFQSLESSLVDHETSMRTVLDTTVVDGFHQICSLLTDTEHTIIAALDSQLQSWMHEKLHLLESDVNGALDKLRAEAAKMADHVVEVFRSQIQGLGQEIADEVLDQIRAAIASVISSAVSGAMKQIAKTAVITETGATVTESLTEFMPEIIIVRDALRAIQMAVDAAHGKF
jgi:hypothetical protein